MPATSNPPVYTVDPQQENKTIAIEKETGPTDPMVNGGYDSI
jgi:hypothetical protein